MTAQIAAYGRLGTDPEERQSQAGKTWASTSLACQITDNGDQGEDGMPPQWFRVVAFGRVAETLARHSKGDLVSVSGRLTMNRWRDREGNDREQLQIVADTVVSARSVRPGGHRKRVSGGEDHG